MDSESERRSCRYTIRNGKSDTLQIDNLETHRKLTVNSRNEYVMLSGNKPLALSEAKGKHLREPG